MLWISLAHYLQPISWIVTSQSVGREEQWTCDRVRLVVWAYGSEGKEVERLVRSGVLGASDDPQL